MTWLTPEFLTSGAGVLASVCAALAGLVRFQAWWLDRARQRRIESATWFKEKGSADWQAGFGEEQLVRANFAALTGIDRMTGHQAMVRCHSRLGGTDAAWKTLCGVGHFLVVTGHVARVRRLRRPDHIRLVVAVAVAVLFGMVGFFIFVWTVNAVTKADWSTVKLIDGVVVLIAITYASMFAFFTLLLVRHCATYFNARSLYRQMVKSGKARRKARVQQRRPVSFEDLQLVEVDRRAEPGAKPYLVSADR